MQVDCAALQRQVGERQSKEAFDAQRDRCDCLTLASASSLLHSPSSIRRHQAAQGANQLLHPIMHAWTLAEHAGTGLLLRSTMTTWCAARSRQLMQPKGISKGKCWPFSRLSKATTLALTGISTGQTAFCWTPLLGNLFQ